MSQVYNPEADQIAEIERLEFSARQIRRRIEHVVHPAERRVLNREISDLQAQIEFLRMRLD